MNIVVFTDTYHPSFNGIVTSIIKSTNEMAKRGHKILIFGPKCKNDDQEEIINHPNITVERYISIPTPGYKEFRLTIPNFIKTRKLAKQFNPDVIHIHTPGPLGFLGLLLAKNMKIKSIMTYHTYLPDFLVCVSPASIFHISELYEKLSITKILRKIDDALKDAKLGHTTIYDIKEKVKEKRPRPAKQAVIALMNKIHNQADLVTTPSVAMKRVLKHENLKAPVKFLSNGINCKLFTPKKTYKHQKKIIHVGRISYEKNVEVIIFAMKKLLESHPDATLHIYGTGPADNYLKEIVAQENLDKNVFFHGFIAHDQLPKIYQEHDIFVTASTIETQGLVILEAMACGLPVVGVDKLAIPDLIKNDEDGYVVEPFAPDKMGRVLTQMLNHPEKFSEYGKRSIEIAKGHDFNNVMDELENTYKELSKKTEE